MARDNGMHPVCWTGELSGAVPCPEYFDEAARAAHAWEGTKYCGFIDTLTRQEEGKRKQGNFRDGIGRWELSTDFAA
jgi:hypothetical protein